VSSAPGPFSECPAITWELIEQCRNLPRYHATKPIGPNTIRRHFPHLNDAEARSIWLLLRGEKNAGQTISPPHKATAKELDSRKRWQVEEEDETLRIWSIDDSVRTVDEAIAKGGVDLAVWEPTKTTVNSWPVAMKQTHEDGSTEAQTVWLWQVKVEFKRRLARPLEEASKIISERMAAHAPKYQARKYTKPTDPAMLEVSIVDHHFGKLAWAPETGEDYDLDIAEQVYQAAAEDLLRQAAGWNITEIVLPVGNDLFNYDNTRGTTEGGTPQDNDSRPAKVYGAAVMAVVHAIDLLLGVAPVTVRYVKGNHDPSWSYHLLWTIYGWYHNAKHVTVDLDPRARKYVEWGVNLLGYSHGDMSQQQLRQLPTVMAVEAKEAWARTLYHEWHVGHWHRRRQIQTMPMEQYGGITIRELPSLCGTDVWHYDQGYVSSLKMADAFVWPKDRPLAAVLTTYADLKTQGRASDRLYLSDSG